MSHRAYDNEITLMIEDPVDNFYRYGNKRRHGFIRHWCKLSRCVSCWLESKIYDMSSWFFPFWVSLYFTWLHNYLFEKRMMSTTNGKSHGNNYILPVVGWIFVMVWYIMDMNKQSVLFRSSLVVISYTHFFIITYKLHWVCVIERGLLSSIYFRHFYIIYMSIFKETIIKNKTIFFDSFNFNERLLNSVTDSKIF
jgi:hypothetical protein